MRFSDQSHSALPDRQFNPSAALFAWLWPGAGHLSIGQRRRGLLIMFGVLFLFFTGLLVGGIDSVDRRTDFLWFLAQSINGPLAFVADFINQNYLKTLPPEQQYPTIAVNRPNEMGTLFIALSGLMNLVVILDALYFAPKADDERPQVERRKDLAASTTA